jgi:mono/diheme cytochrome c family protein
LIWIKCAAAPRRDDGASDRELLMPTDHARSTPLRRAALRAAGVLLLSTSAAWAAGDPGAGAEVARTWCASCHLVGDPAAGSTTQGPPSFRALARGPTRTPDELRAFLTKPHPPMPDLSLSRAQIDDLVAYIESLR